MLILVLILIVLFYKYVIKWILVHHDQSYRLCATLWWVLLSQNLKVGKHLVAPQPTEVDQYKKNSCTLKPKTELVLIKNSTEFFFFWIWVIIFFKNWNWNFFF